MFQRSLAPLFSGFETRRDVGVKVSGNQKNYSSETLFGFQRTKICNIIFLSNYQIKLKNLR
jgi:hypothetical protein